MTLAARGIAAAGAAIACLALAGCRDAQARPLAAASTPPAAASPTPTTSPSSPRPTPDRTAPTPSKSPSRVPAASAPPFTSSVAAVTAAQLGKSWHSGCPVGPSALRALTVRYWGFDSTAHLGTLVVNANAVAPVREAFRRIYLDRFPIRRMVPIAAYGGDDNRSMAADNTSAFNCRYAVANGPKRWSMHAYGDAVDIDPVENPYTLDGTIYPPNGTAYTARGDVRPGMVVPGSAPVRAFGAVSWGWGGRWSSSPDYQHFSSSGQ